MDPQRRTRAAAARLTRAAIGGDTHADMATLEDIDAVDLPGALHEATTLAAHALLEAAGRIPAGSFGLFPGHEGTGKSPFLTWLSAQVTNGELAGAFKGDPRAVNLRCRGGLLEVHHRPAAHGGRADLTKVYGAEVEVSEGETVTLSLPSDNKYLAA